MNIRITQEDLTEEYLSKFPTKVHEKLEDEEFRKDFLETVYKEYESVIVYRAIHRADELKDDDFYYDLLECEHYNRQIKEPYNISNYAISVNEDINQLKLSVRFPNVRRPLLGIAKGIMNSCFGPADNINDKTHHNWYLFENEVSRMRDRFSVYKENEDEGNE